MSKLASFLAWLLHAIMCPVGNVLLWGKRRCGFVDLGRDVEVVGRVVGYDPGGGDGDVCFNVVADGPYAFLRFYKGRDTTEGTPGTIHCEFTPCAQLGALRALLDEVVRRCAAGEQPVVRIRGRWSYDGVHSNDWKTDGLTFKEVWSCLVGHGANELDGWTELHPATDIEVLN